MVAFLELGQLPGAVDGAEGAGFERGLEERLLVQGPISARAADAFSPHGLQESSSRQASEGLPVVAAHEDVVGVPCAAVIDTLRGDAGDFFQQLF